MLQIDNKTQLFTSKLILTVDGDGGQKLLAKKASEIQKLAKYSSICPVTAAGWLRGGWAQK